METLREGIDAPPSAIQLRILGTLIISGSAIGSPIPSRAVCQVIALIAASGRDGISRDELAHELWDTPLPESWKSAIRNRMTAARKVLGANTVLRDRDRFRLAEFVSVDSWELIVHAADEVDHVGEDLGFLDGEVLAGIDPSPLVRTHATQVADARAIMIQQLVANTRHPLTRVALQSLRAYQRLHPLDAIVTQEVVRAHLVAGESNYATTIIVEVKQLAGTQPTKLTWVDQLDRITGVLDPAEPARAAGVHTRADLFDSAARDENWNVALEIAMVGLPEAEQLSGDPERLKLLEAIPLEKLDASRQLSFCVTLSRNLMYVGRELEAHDWSRTARSLARSADDELLAYITAAMVGEARDERTPIPLPASFDQADDETVNMRSLQVAVKSHLERASFEEAQPLLRRFNGLVEASADPYRRWLGLLLSSMCSFAQGDLEEAEDTAWQAFSYGDLFGIVDAEVVLIGQLSNPRWLHQGFNGPADYVHNYPASADSDLSRALQSLALADEDNGEAVNTFLRSFNINSRSFFTFATIMILAGRVSDPELRRRVATRLKARTGTSGIWGAGVMHLGPVDRTLAQLVDNQPDREMHLTAAMHCADRQRTRLWQVVCRLDLAAATANTEHHRQAKALATKPALKQLIDTYPGLGVA